MKNRLLILFLLLVSLLNAQGSDKREFDYLGYYKFKGGVSLPPPFNPYFPTPEEGQLAYDSSVKNPVYHNGIEWISLGAQFTGAQKTALLALIYQSNSSTLSVAPASGERGVSTPLTVTYGITTGNDVFTSASINNGIGAVTWNTGSHSVSAGNAVVTTNITLTKNFTRNGTPTTQPQSITYTAHAPQWAGNSTATDYTAASYATINSTGTLTKFLQGTSTISKAFTAGSRAWFIVTSATGTITGNGFTYSIGEWGSTAFFWRKPISNFVLADGITTSTLYLISSSENLTGAITFTHSN